jgi:hypothetical protein
MATWTAETSHPQCGGFYTQNKVYETLKHKIVPAPGSEHGTC